MSIMNGGGRGTTFTLSHMRAVAAFPHSAATAQRAGAGFLPCPAPAAICGIVNPSLTNLEYITDGYSYILCNVIRTNHICRRTTRSARPP